MIEYWYILIPLLPHFLSGFILCVRLRACIHWMNLWYARLHWCIPLYPPVREIDSNLCEVTRWNDYVCYNSCNKAWLSNPPWFFHCACLISFWKLVPTTVSNSCSPANFLRQWVLYTAGLSVPRTSSSRTSINLCGITPQVIDSFYQRRCRKLFPEVLLCRLFFRPEDDTFLGEVCYPIDFAKSSATFHFEMPEYGGHLGFMSPDTEGYLWTDNRAVAFVLD